MKKISEQKNANVFCVQTRKMNFITFVHNAIPKFCCTKIYCTPPHTAKFLVNTQACIANER